MSKAFELYSLLKENETEFREDWKDNSVIELIKGLKDSDITVIIQEMEDRDNTTRFFAVYTLGRIFLVTQDPRALEPLIAALQDGDEGVRTFAAEALGYSKDPRAVEPLIAALNTVLNKGGVYSSGTHIISALGDTGDPRAVKPLIDILKNDYNCFLTSEAANALLSIQHPRVIESLVTILEDKNEDIIACNEAKETLSKIRGSWAIKPFVDLLGNEDFSISYPALHALHKINPDWRNLPVIKEKVSELIPVLKDKDKNQSVRHNAAKFLGLTQDPHAVQPLIAELKDAGSHIRSIAAQALGNIGDPRAVEPLIAALKDVGLAPRALSKIRDPRAVEPLIAILKDENEDRGLRDCAQMALGDMQNQRAIKVLVDVLFSSIKEYDSIEDDFLSNNITVTLANYRDSFVLELLFAALENKDYALRSKARKAIVKVLDYTDEPRRIFKFLLTALMTRSENSRSNIAMVLNDCLKRRRLATIFYYVMRDETDDVHSAVADAMDSLSTLYPLKRFLKKLLGMC